MGIADGEKTIWPIDESIDGWEPGHDERVLRIQTEAARTRSEFFEEQRRQEAEAAGSLATGAEVEVESPADPVVRVQPIAI